MGHGFVRLGLLLAGFSVHPVSAADDMSNMADRSRRPLSGLENASADVRQQADWVALSGDNGGLPFIIVDKKEAKVFLFKADGLLVAASPALLGAAVGDDSVPGIGDRKLSSIRPEERTTPAGRFVAALGRNASGVDILWVDYAGAVSLHRVVTGKPAERRQERLKTPTPLDNRISYGCINVPVRFYEDSVRPAFSATNGIVYVLPETRSLREVFASHRVDPPVVVAR